MKRLIIELKEDGTIETKQENLTDIESFGIIHILAMPRTVKNTALIPEQKKRHIDTLKMWDTIVFDKVMSKYLTVGKEYLVTYVADDWAEYDYAWFRFKDDQGNSKSLRKILKGYVMRII